MSDQWIEVPPDRVLYNGHDRPRQFEDTHVLLVFGNEGGGVLVPGTAIEVRYRLRGVLTIEPYGPGTENGDYLKTDGNGNVMNRTHRVNFFGGMTPDWYFVFRKSAA